MGDENGATATPHPTRLGECKPLRGLAVLVVDDHPDARRMMTATLRVAGARPVAVEGCRQALQALADIRFNVLIADICMPDEDGFDLIRAVRALPPEDGGRIPAVAVTGFAGYGDRTFILQSGFQALLRKPVDGEVLLRTVAELAQG